MKFKFSKDLDYQLDAINSVVGLFDTGRNIVSASTDFSWQNPGQIIANELDIDVPRIVQNLQTIQKENLIDQVDTIATMDFSIEMETGTGKTYVYLRTALQLHATYGLKKFIILVPSAAIREGVLKTIEQTREHFRSLYGIGFGSFAYDSDSLNRVRDFAQSQDVQIMVMTIQSFNSDGKVLRQTDRDNTYGERSYLDLIARTNPVVIMDEPQNMESDLSKSAIADLNALFKLRYSATHKQVYNLVYRLTPVEAYQKGLVKKIAVYGVKELNTGAFIFRVVAIETAKGQGPKARVMLEVKNADGTYRMNEMILSAGNDLYRKSMKNEKYADLIVQEIDARHGRVELSNGQYYLVDAGIDDIEAIFRTQVRETIKAHFDKQRELGDRIKVLSLFFIDKVDNYVPEGSLIRRLFVEEFTKLQNNYTEYKDIDVSAVHRGYFASKKSKGVVEYRDSTTGSSKEDKEAYNLIMKNKEQLLSFAEPVRFIFSHSALKEGWDNPNIFQICTMREAHVLMRKRQEIGRGLRLPVDVNGDRVYDPSINILTVIANSSYEEYAGSLQTEFMEAGYRGDIDTINAREKKTLIRTTKNLSSPEFTELWNRISQRTKFSLEVSTETLITAAVERLNQLDISGVVITIERGQVFFDDQGNFESARDTSGVGYKIDRTITIPNIVDRISRETGLTRLTVFAILGRVESTDALLESTEEYIRSAILIIKNELSNLLINDGLKYVPTGETWEISLLFKDFEALPSRVLRSERSVYDYVAFDSIGEREFAERLENNQRVKVYSKLPRGFVVDTPLGKYVPDWAIVWHTPEGEKLYLVRETKFGYDNLEQQLTYDEWQKIACAQKHFETIGVDFKVAQSEELMDLL